MSTEDLLTFAAFVAGWILFQRFVLGGRGLGGG
jgi:hypothetical protein